MGREGLGSMNENYEMFTELCDFNRSVIGGSILQNNNAHKTTRVSSNR